MRWSWDGVESLVRLLHYVSFNSFWCSLRLMAAGRRVQLRHGRRFLMRWTYWGGERDFLRSQREINGLWSRRGMQLWWQLCKDYILHYMEIMSLMLIIFYITWKSVLNPIKLSTMENSHGDAQYFFKISAFLSSICRHHLFLNGMYETFWEENYFCKLCWINCGKLKKKK